MSRYSKQFNANETPQSEKIPGSSQVANSAGGFSFEVNDWIKLDRFLILGTEGGSYYAGEREMTIKNAEAALRCLASDGLRVVRRIVEISEAGRAPKNDPAIFVLALAAKKGDDVTRKAALEAMPRVCRIGTHLFQFVEAMQGFGGWGRGTRRAVANWYTSKDANALAYQLVKYRQRNGWSHKDTILLAHPGKNGIDSIAAKYAIGKTSPEENLLIAVGGEKIPRVLTGFMNVQTVETAKEIVKIIGDYPELPWEAIPSQFLKNPDIWNALLPNMKTTALIRNLGRMTANGAIQPMSEAKALIVKHLGDAERIRKQRVHPITVLAALGTYRQGHGEKGKLTWTPIPAIVDALDEAFYLAFGNVEPSNKRTLIALDVSGSMGTGTISGIPGITPRVGSAAMAMVTARTEPNYEVVGFTSTMASQGRYGGKWGGNCNGLTHIDITPKQRLDAVCNKVAALPMGGTDCALPMLYAAEKKMPVDTFVVYTDSETWAGKIHPSQALKQYRQKMGIPAKLVVVAMLSNPFSIADPADAGMLDCIGFDTATPNIISDFAVQ